jgi:hypothetical protein
MSTYIYAAELIVTDAKTRAEADRICNELVDLVVDLNNGNPDSSPRIDLMYEIEPEIEQDKAE